MRPRRCEMRYVRVMGRPDTRDEMQSLLEREVDRRLADVGRRLDGASTKAGVVIGAAAVVATASAGPAPWTWVPVGLSIFAGLLAAASLLYRNGAEVPVLGMSMRYGDYSPQSMANEIFRKKLCLLMSEEAAMTPRANKLMLSYAYLGLAVSALIWLRLIAPA